jgi:hypothetical protein
MTADLHLRRRTVRRAIAVRRLIRVVAFATVVCTCPAAPAGSAPARHPAGSVARSAPGPAGGPSAVYSILPVVIPLVGTGGGIADPLATFTVIVRDESDQPVPDTPVVVDFSNCPDARPAAEQPYLGLSVDCPGLTVSAVTDAEGRADFCIVGGVRQFAPASAGACARILAGPSRTQLGVVRVGAYDLDGVDGVGIHDALVWSCDWSAYVFGLQYRARSDLNGDLMVNAGDLSFFTAVWARMFSTRSGARCDGLPAASPQVVAADGGINLAWGDCVGGGGTSTQTFACDANTSRFFLHGSVIAPSSPQIDSLVAWEAVLDIVAPPGSTLPTWWRPWAGECRRGAFHDTTKAGTCDPFPDPPPPISGIGQILEYPSGSDSVARYHLVGTSERRSLEPGVEYEIFRMALDTRRTVGTGSCAGCGTPVAIALRSLTLWEGQGCTDPDPLAARRVLLSSPATRAYAVWQSDVFTSVEPGPAPAGPRLWIAEQNPTTGPIRIGFVLAGGPRARVEVLDPMGRRVQARSLEGFGAGVHLVTLDLPEALGPGVYFVRLSQGARTAVARAVLLR